MSEAATKTPGRPDARKAIMINDVARAYFEADARRQVCVELPEAETGGKNDEDLVAPLLKSLYGARDAAKNFQFEIRKVLENNVFTTGTYNVNTYCHPTR